MLDASNYYKPQNLFVLFLCEGNLNFEYLYIELKLFINMELREFIATTIREYLNEQQEVENNNFKKWFGSSKVVYNGKPLPVYHGSTIEIEEFKDFTTFFTDDYMNADGYAGGEYVYEVYISIKRPLIIDCQDKKWDAIKTEYGTSTREVVGNVDRSKYDGVIFINIKDSWIDDVDYQDASTVFVTFKANQIKSVDNDGTWDLNDNNIYS
jgi:hypothetical protein